MRKHPSTFSRSPRRSSRGFALLITITLLAFLVLLLVSLASLTRVETQVAGNNQQLSQARQNALMALSIALGQLQKHTGPNQRVTGPADVIKPSALTWSASSTPATALTADTSGIDAYWQGTKRNRHWTGAWKNANAITFDANNPTAFNPSPALQSWLVSGNENVATGDAFKPTDIVTGLSTSSTALDEITDANGKYQRLLVKAAAGVSDNASLDRAVTAPEMEIKSTSVPGTDGSATVVGHYAWWVGDEGVKARANLVDPYASAGTTDANRIRFQSAQRVAVEAMTTTGTDGLSSYPANADSLLKVLMPAQLDSLGTAATFPTELQARFHDLSVTSRGVLSDTKHGGLKADLTYILGQSTQSNFLAALRASYGGTAIASLSTTASSLSANPLLTSTGTPLAALPSGYASDFFKNTATWEQLWSFANQGSSINAAGQATPRRHTAVQHGLYPLVIQTKMFYRLRFVGGAADAAGVNRTGVLWVDSIPVVLLANPYAVPLAAADYQLRVSITSRTTNTNLPELVFSPNSTTWTNAYAIGSEPAYAGSITFVLRTPGMAAGEAQIFTIDPDPTVNTGIDADDRITVASSSSTNQVVMKNDFDPSPALTYNTSQTLPAADTYAALQMEQGAMTSSLYMDYDAAQKDRRLIQYITAQQDSSGYVSGASTLLVVDPMSDGIRQGGGSMLVINQPPTTYNPNTLFTYQQAPFLQVNYRSPFVYWTGNTSIEHPLQWARRFDKNGSTGSAGTTPNPWLEANLMRPSGSITTSRWGIANIGEGQSQTEPPASIGGTGASSVGFNNFLYDIPRSGHPLSSLGQLQHFNTSGYVPDTSSTSYSRVGAWQINYPIANSYPQPRVPRDQLFSASSSSLGTHFDGAFLWNDLVWDRFTFSTYPQTGSFSFATDKLVNSRYRPFRGQNVVAWNDTSSFRGDGNASTAANARIAAQNLLVDGAFNINSTSVEAWKAVFSSLKNIPVGTESSPSAPFVRTLTPTAGSAGAATGVSPDSWTGFRDLSHSEIQSLAEEMVMQVRKRGPFLSLSEFVNRRLIASGSDTYGLGLSGALQAALDRVVNLSANLAAAFRVQSATTGNALAENGYILPSALAGFPGYLLQGDVFSALGSTLAARSDTFTIRTYGDAINPATGAVTGRAWCEAIAQRTPDYVVPKNGSAGDAPTDTVTDATNLTFGRRYQIVGFRWLSSDDL